MDEKSPGIGAKYVLPDGAAVRAKINNKSEVKWKASFTKDFFLEKSSFCHWQHPVC